MSEQYQLTMNDYLSILRRRWALLLFPFLLIFAASIGVALVIPPVYKSTGTILVESQQISEELIRTTITSFAEERIQVIKQRVMTRDNLQKIIEKFDLYAKERGKLTITEVMEKMRGQVEIVPTKSEVRNHRRGSTTLSFTVSYEDRNSLVAYRVANELVTLFLNENVRTRTERAAETTEFLTQEADKLKKQLEINEKELAAYKQKFKDALPEHLDLRMNMLERTESSIRDAERELKTAQEERRFLDIELSSARTGVTDSTTPAGPAQELSRLKLEYAKKSSVYGSSHPDVRALKRNIDSLSKEVGVTVSSDDLRKALTSAENERTLLLAKYADSHPQVKRLDLRIAQLNKDLKAHAAGTYVTETESIPVARVQAKIKAADERITSLSRQLQELNTRHKEIEEQILLTPQVQRGLVSLTRDYENTLKKYKEIQEKQMEAKLAESLEENKKAERFSLLEPPLQPEKPVKPNRKKLMALGFVAAVGGSGGLVMLLESIDQRIRGSQALTALLRRRPLVVIPYITLQEEIQRRKRWLKILIAVAVVGFILVLVATHLLYMPLDLLLLKVMARLGG